MKKLLIAGLGILMISPMFLQGQYVGKRDRYRTQKSYVKSYNHRDYSYRHYRHTNRFIRRDIRRLHYLEKRIMKLHWKMQNQYMSRFRYRSYARRLYRYKHEAQMIRSRLSRHRIRY